MERKIWTKEMKVKCIKKLLDKNKKTYKYIRNILEEEKANKKITFRKRVNLKAVNDLIANRRMSI